MALLVDDILLAPVKLVQWIGETLHESAEQELTDESLVQERLLELQMRYELNDMTAEEYERAEDALMARLQAIREHKQEKEE